MNHGTITSTLSWYKILPLNGFNLIRANQKLHRRRKKSSSVFSNRHRSLKLFIRTTHWSLGIPVNSYYGIIERRRLVDPRLTELLKERYAMYHWGQNEYHNNSQILSPSIFGHKITGNLVITLNVLGPVIGSSSNKQETHLKKEHLIMLIGYFSR